MHALVRNQTWLAAAVGGKSQMSSSPEPWTMVPSRSTRNSVIPYIRYIDMVYKKIQHASSI